VVSNGDKKMNLRLQLTGLHKGLYLTVPIQLRRELQKSINKLAGHTLGLYAAGGTPDISSQGLGVCGREVPFP
jgi:hypothetical protein